MALFSKAAFRAYAAFNAVLIGVVSWLLLTPDPAGALSLQPTHWLLRLDDLLVHGGVFVVLTVCFLIQFVNRPVNYRRRAIAFLFLYAALTESLQFFVPGRFADPADVVANIAGIACGLIVLFVCDRSRRTIISWVVHGGT